MINISVRGDLTHQLEELVDGVKHEYGGEGITARMPAHYQAGTPANVDIVHLADLTSVPEVSQRLPGQQQMIAPKIMMLEEASDTVRDEAFLHEVQRLGHGKSGSVVKWLQYQLQDNGRWKPQELFGRSGGPRNAASPWIAVNGLTGDVPTYDVLDIVYTFGRFEAEALSEVLRAPSFRGSDYGYSGAIYFLFRTPRAADLLCANLRQENFVTVRLPTGAMVTPTARRLPESFRDKLPANAGRVPNMRPEFPDGTAAPLPLPAPPVVPTSPAVPLATSTGPSSSASPAAPAPFGPPMPRAPPTATKSPPRVRTTKFDKDKPQLYSLATPRTTVDGGLLVRADKPPDNRVQTGWFRGHWNTALSTVKNWRGGDNGSGMQAEEDTNVVRAEAHMSRFGAAPGNWTHQIETPAHFSGLPEGSTWTAAPLLAQGQDTSCKRPPATAATAATAPKRAHTTSAAGSGLLCTQPECQAILAAYPEVKAGHYTWEDYAQHHQLTIPQYHGLHQWIAKIEEKQNTEALARAEAEAKAASTPTTYGDGAHEVFGDAQEEELPDPVARTPPGSGAGEQGGTVTAGTAERTVDTGRVRTTLPGAAGTSTSSAAAPATSAGADANYNPLPGIPPSVGHVAQAVDALERDRGTAAAP